MSDTEAKPEDPDKGLPKDDDVILGVAPDADMEAAMSQALAPVVARATNGTAESGVIEVTSAGEARTPVAAAPEVPEPTIPASAPVAAESMNPPDVSPVTEPGAPDSSPRQPRSDSAARKKHTEAEPLERTPELPVVGSSPFDGISSQGRSDPTANPMDTAEEPPAEPAPPPEVKSAEPPEPTPDPPPVAAARASEFAVMVEPSAGNRVYDHLVEGDDDVIGLITYSLYEKDRRDWLQHWQRQHGADPTADQHEAFVEAQLTFSQRDRYRSAARQVLDAYASVAVDLEKPVIIRDGIAGRVEDAAKRVEGSGRWWRQLPAAVVGGIAAALVIAGIVAILVAAGVDIAGYLGFEQAGAADGLS